MRWVTAFAAVTLALTLGTPALAKEDVEARLRQPLPPDPAPGSVIHVAWTLTILESGGRPFNACGVFVQLRSRAAGQSTRAYADPSCAAHPNGEYAADVVVPQGGMGALEIGLSGTTDVFFPVVGVLSPTSTSPTSTAVNAPGESAQIPWPLVLGTVVALLALVATAARSRDRRIRMSR